jgi:hypothetical protein
MKFIYVICNKFSTFLTINKIYLEFKLLSWNKYWFFLGFMHGMRGEFSDDVSGAAVGPIFTGHESQRDQWRWDSERLPKHRRNIYFAQRAKTLKQKLTYILILSRNYYYCLRKILFVLKKNTEHKVNKGRNFDFRFTTFRNILQHDTFLFPASPFHWRHFQVLDFNFNKAVGPVGPKTD